jgi:hypothetical protein
MVVVASAFERQDSQSAFLQQSLQNEHASHAVIGFFDGKLEYENGCDVTHGSRSLTLS